VDVKDAIDPVSGFLGGDLLRPATHGPRERDDAAIHLDADLGLLDSGVPLQLP
jgi:hypothetical protein